MELNISKQAVIINDVAYEGNLEQPIESDVLLPDYCPDIMKILRCLCHPVITGTQVSGDKLAVDMNCIVTVYYLGADKTIRRIEQKLPYTKTCELKAAAQDPVADACARADYVNCRAVNQRRFEIRCAVTVSCRVFSRASAEVVSGAHGGGIQLKTSACDVTEVSGDISRAFSVHEDLQLSASKPPVQSVIRQDCVCRIGDYKIISGKVIVKGELLIHLLYQPESPEARPEVMEYALPISQIVDVEGVDEECVCEVTLGVLSAEFTPKADLDGESRLLALDCSLGAHVRAHRRRRLDLISDCYSTEYECRIERTPICCLNLLKIVDERYMHKCTVPLPEGAQTVVDMFCTVMDVSPRMEQGAAVAVVKLLVCMFACDAQGEIAYHEQPEECEIRVPVDGGGENALFFPRGYVLSCSFSMSGADTADCRCEVGVSGCVYALARPKAASSLSCDTASPKERGADASLIIYYASGGEDVWEIAKRYNTSLEAVMGENGLDGTTLQEKQMLLIPIV